LINSNSDYKKIMFTSSEDIQVYRNQLKQKYSQVREKFTDRGKPLDENSSIYGVNLPFLNLSQTSKILSNHSLLNNSLIGPIRLTTDSTANNSGGSE
jgi:hypothetical protein